ncbi:MAG: class I SAM-dependent methyltransferase [Euzebyales bacterium]|nr:class I SAM-dependent methyltransferase [Euzebyales bacterium]
MSDAGDPGDPKQIVRRGYDAVSRRYRGDDDDDPRYAAWLAEITGRIAPGEPVLDLGCGAGVPAARLLAARHPVTGVDLSEVQIARALTLVPNASFLVADMTAVGFRAASFAAVVSLFALIHVPLAEQPPLLARIRGWLRPGGWLLATTGDTAWTGTEDDWLGAGAAMFWSHADRETYRRWLVAAGFEVVWQRFVPEADAGHSLVLAQARGGNAGPCDPGWR